jgi:hypothetical protein
LLNRDTGFQPSHNVQAVVVAAGNSGKSSFGIGGERGPEMRRVGEREVKTCGHDADDGRKLVADLDALTRHAGRTSEVLHPERVTE